MPARIGLHVGPSMPSIQGGTSEQSKGYTSRLGPYFGVSIDYDLGPKLSVRTEVNFASEGGKRNGMQPVSADQIGDLPIPPGITLYADFDNEDILDYIEIPVMARLTWGRRHHFFVEAGPYVGFLARAKAVTSGSSSLYIDEAGTPLVIDDQPLPPVSFDAHTDIKESINFLSSGLAGGLGLETPVGPGDIVLETHFSLGLSNIQKHPDVDGRNNTGAAVLTLGYSYPMGGER
ncbi:MAG TPA: porin family protein [bacterium]|nr:porin family protein [bacterium]